MKTHATALRKPPLLDRLLALADGGGPELVAGKLAAFRHFLLLYGAARSWLWLHFLEERSAVFAASAVLMTVAFALTLRPRLAHWGPRLALPIVLYHVSLTFPGTANHNFLELYCVTLLCLLDPREPEADRLVLRGLSWMAVIIFFLAGLQKVSYGYYFRGDFLAFMVGAQERFATLFGLILPAAEVARLRAYDELTTGAGPYRVSSPLFIVASNLVWIGELALPPLMIWRRTRTLATLGAILLLGTIQLGALEFGFAVLFINLLLLLLPGNWNRRLLPYFAALLVLAALLGLAGLPIMKANYL
jgi:hypothetical protein